MHKPIVLTLTVEVDPDELGSMLRLRLETLRSFLGRLGFAKVGMKMTLQNSHSSSSSNSTGS